MNIRTAPANTLDLGELTIAVAHLGILTDRIRDNGHDVPEDLKLEFQAAERELAERLRGDKERRLKVLETRLEGLQSVPQKRKKIEGDIAKLRKDIGQRDGRK